MSGCNHLNYPRNGPPHLHVGEVYLSDDVDEVEQLTEEEPEGVEVVVVEVDAEVVDQHGLALTLDVVVQDGIVELHHQHLHLPALPDLPQVPRNVEHDSLEGG